jgi:hypothetical protein
LPPASGSTQHRAITNGGLSVRSLWRILALRWLGGQGSEALTGNSAPLDLLMTGEPARIPHAVEKRRQSGVSHHATRSRQGSEPAILEPVIVEKSSGEHSR